ncbi:MAG: SdpI family protein [Acidimicrobiales bacterium]
MLKALRLAISGVVVIGLGQMAATGRLPRNLFAGIRIPSTMRSDEAWRAGHQAAASALTVAGVGPVVSAIIVVATRPGSKVQTVLSRISTGWLVGWIGYATVEANRAARAINAD